MVVITCLIMIMEAVRRRLFPERMHRVVVVHWNEVMTCRIMMLYVDHPASKSLSSSSDNDSDSSSSSSLLSSDHDQSSPSSSCGFGGRHDHDPVHEKVIDDHTRQID